MLKLRQARPEDAPHIWHYVNTLKDRFFDDYTSKDDVTIKQACLNLADSPDTLVIEDGEMVVGTFYFTAIHDLHLEIHMVFEPALLKQVLKDQLVEQVIDYAFKHYKVFKIRAELMETQKATISFAKRLKFHPAGRLRAETKVNGKRVDVLLFELTKEYWKYHRKKQKKALLAKENSNGCNE